MIYLDSSVALAYLFGEGRSPPPSIWAENLVSSVLLEYEVWNRVNARNFAAALGTKVSDLLDRPRLFELNASVLRRALLPFPIPVRTLDSLHLATLDFIRGQGETVELASYDGRLTAAAQALGFPLAGL